MSIEGGTGAHNSGSSNTNYGDTNGQNISKEKIRAKKKNIRNKINDRTVYSTTESTKTKVPEIDIKERKIRQKELPKHKVDKKQVTKVHASDTNKQSSPKNKTKQNHPRTDAANINIQNNFSSSEKQLKQNSQLQQDASVASTLNDQQLKHEKLKNSYEELKHLYNNTRYIEKGEVIGKGNCGSVNKATLITPKMLEQEIAYKSQANNDWNSQTIIKQEYNILNKLDSPYIIKVFPQLGPSNKKSLFDFVSKGEEVIYDEVLDTFRPVASLDEKEDAMEIIEKAELSPSGLAMDLKFTNFAEASATQSPAEIETIIHDMLQGLVYLKAKGIGHCDIKPENVLVDSKGHAVIADAGTAIESEKRTMPVGTPIYMSPDAYKNYCLNLPFNDNNVKLPPSKKKLRENPYSTYELDSWGAGICIVRAYCHHLPNGGIETIKYCCLLKECELISQLSDSGEEKNYNKNFKSLWNSLINEIPITCHREIARGLLQKKWTVNQALDHLLHNGITFKKGAEKKREPKQPAHSNFKTSYEPSEQSKPNNYEQTQNSLPQDVQKTNISNERFDELKETESLLNRLQKSTNINIYNLSKLKRTFNRLQQERVTLGKLSKEGYKTLTLVNENAKLFLSTMIEYELESINTLFERITKTTGVVDPELIKMKIRYAPLNSKCNPLEPLDINDHQALMTLKDHALSYLIQVTASGSQVNIANRPRSTSPLNPLKISDKFSQLFNNEFSELIANAENKKEITENILNYMLSVHKQWSQARDSYSQSLDTVEHSNTSNDNNFMNHVFKQKGSRFTLKQEFIDPNAISKHFHDINNEENPETLKNFIMKVNNLMAAMACQTPPCTLTLPKKGASFNEIKNRAFLNKGSYIDYNIWPILYLYQGGPLLNKGVSQLTNEKP